MVHIITVSEHLTIFNVLNLLMCSFRKNDVYPPIIKVGFKYSMIKVSCIIKLILGGKKTWHWFWGYFPVYFSTCMRLGKIESLWAPFSLVAGQEKSKSPALPDRPGWNQWGLKRLRLPQHVCRKVGLIRDLSLSDLSLVNGLWLWRQMVFRHAFDWRRCQSNKSLFAPECLLGTCMNPGMARSTRHNKYNSTIKSVSEKYFININ